jgi:hypothetical protein
MTLVDGNTMLARRYRCTRSQGREMISHRANPGAYLAAFPPTPGRLRSMSLDCIVFDECQEHTQELGQALMADSGPTFATRPRRQHILMGTAPDGPSGWWADQLARGRAGHFRLIEIGTWPDDADPEDPDTWRRYHPGVKAGLTDVGYLTQQLHELGLERFAREYGNRTPGGASLDTPLTEELWRAAQYGGAAPSLPLVVGFDAAGDGSAATAVAAGRLPDGRLVAGITAMEAGTAWLPDALVDLKRRWPRLKLAADATGPAAAVIDELQQRRTMLMPHPALETARTLAKRRWTDAGGWVWSRRRSGGDISPLTAWTAALWVARQRSSVKPQVVASSS